MFKVIRRLTALIAVVALAVKGFFAFISWMEKSDESHEMWSDEEEYEEV